MNKFILLSGIGVVLAGCSMLPGSQPAEEQSTQDQQQEAQELAEGMMAGKEMECTMTTPEGDEMEYTIKGELMRVSGMDMEDGKVGTMIKDNTDMYIWTDGESQGTKIPLPSEETMEKVQDAAEEYLDQVPDLNVEEEQQRLEDEGYTINCDEASLSDDMFVPPAEVEFVSLADMFGGVMEEVMQGMGDELSPELQEQIQQQMEQMGQ